MNELHSIGYKMSYSIHWSSIRIAFLPAFPVPPSQALYAFNGSIVGLLQDTNYYEDKDPESSKKASSFPTFLTCPQIARSKCVGLGLVKSIDIPSQTFVITTPLKPSQLELVNTIVLGQLEIPPYLFYKVLFFLFLMINLAGSIKCPVSHFRCPW